MSYIYKVRMWLSPANGTERSKNRPISARFSTIKALNEHLKLVFKYSNDRWNTIQVLKGDEVIKEWRR